MNIRSKTAAGVIALMGMGVLAGCGGSDTINPPSPPPPPPPPSSSVAFPAFVKMTLKEPADSEPRTVNGVDFTFPALNDPHAFDDVLPPPSGTSGGG